MANKADGIAALSLKTAMAVTAENPELLVVTNNISGIILFLLLLKNFIINS